MFARSYGSAFEVRAPAKLNLHLHVVGRRDDGFHELETIMTPVALYDRLEHRPLPSGFRLECRNVAIGLPTPPPAADNLATRALNRLADVAGREPTGRFLLEKRIPAEAGLGGGSSDAAAALVLANAAWGLNYSRQRLAEVAAELGSDVPFFLAGGAAICRGRGELITPLTRLPRLPVVVVKPTTGVSTPAAFAALGLPPGTAQPAAPSARLSSRIAAAANSLLAADWRSLRAALFNHLQPAAEQLCVGVARLREAMQHLAVPAHCMTGSGSAYYAVCRSTRQAQRVAALVRARNLGMVFATATCR